MYMCAFCASIISAAVQPDRLYVCFLRVCEGMYVCMYVCMYGCTCMFFGYVGRYARVYACMYVACMYVCLCGRGLFQLPSSQINCIYAHVYVGMCVCM